MRVTLAIAHTFLFASKTVRKIIEFFKTADYDESFICGSLAVIVTATFFIWLLIQIIIVA